MQQVQKVLPEAWPARQIEMWPTPDLVPYARNARTHPPEQVAQIAKSIEKFGFTIPILVAEDGTIIAGHGRLMAAEQLGLAEVPVLVARGWSDEQRRAYTIADNRLAETSEWDLSLLRFELQELEAEADADLLASMGFTTKDLNALLATAPTGDGEQAGEPAEDGAGLAEQFGAVPFSVLNAREGWWSERKRQWIALGIKSEIGRGENLLGMSDTMLEPDPERRAKGLLFKNQTGFMAEEIEKRGGGTSIFDPVLTELCYRWFCPPGGQILDPFAGGSVRGVVASALGRQYDGIELRAEQVAANEVQADELCDEPRPRWHNGDSLDMADMLGDLTADFVFSCPPYADLEVYSDDPRDLSNMEYAAFKEAYFEIIRLACDRLADDRFAAFVVGEVRGEPGGAYINFVADTIEAFRAAGLHYYNEMILVTPAGTLPLRAARSFRASRKVGKTHQNVLVFCKGDPRAATEACGDVEIAVDLPEAPPEEGDDTAGFEVVAGSA